MNDEAYYKIVKLKTGEIIVCSMANDINSFAKENFLELIEPVQVIPQRETRKGNSIVGESFLLKPWIGLSDSEEFIVNTDIILTIGNLKKEVKQQYVDYVNQTAQLRKKIKDYEEREEAVTKLLQDVTPGDVKIIDEVNYLLDEDYDEYRNRE